MTRTSLPAEADASTRQPVAPASRAPLRLDYADGRAGRRGRVARAFVRFGGWRQVGFACGMGFVFGGAGYALGSSTHTLSETPVCTALGGLLIGASLPVRPRGLGRINSSGGRSS